MGLDKRSIANLKDCRHELLVLAEDVNNEIPITVICGRRGEKEQNEAFARGNSKLRYPESKHNKNPSEAIDCCPKPIDFSNIKKFEEMVDCFKKHAKARGIKIVCGADWKMRDYPHIELS